MTRGGKDIVIHQTKFPNLDKLIMEQNTVPVTDQTKH